MKTRNLISLDRSWRGVRQGLGGLLAMTVFLGTPLVLAQTLWGPPPASLSEIIRKIERRQGGWIALKANLTLHFLGSEHHTASCRGELTYQRLDEKILLKGLSEKNELLFVFKTEDRKFEIYLPHAKTLFRGNIFELEDSPDIESHLKPLDLYRALKTMAIPAERAEIEQGDPNSLSLKIRGMRGAEDYLSRRLQVSQEGDVETETYYSFEEKPVLRIHRLEFQRVRIAGASKKGPETAFPRHIQIERIVPDGGRAGGNRQETVLRFHDIHFLITPPEESWLIPVARGTQIAPLRDGSQ